MKAPSNRPSRQSAPRCVPGFGRPAGGLYRAIAMALAVWGVMRPANAQSVPCQPVPSDLIAWYRLDGSPEDTLGRYPGRLVGPLTFGPGQIGGSAAFTSGTAVRVGNAPGLRPQHLTVAAWIKSPFPGRFRHAIAKSLDHTAAASYGLWSGAEGRLEFYVCHGLTPLRVTTSAVAPTAIWDNTWHWIVGSYDGQEVRLYVDGRPTGPGFPGDGPILYGTAESSGDLWLGNGRMPTQDPDLDPDPDLQWPGQLDDVQLYHRALTASEVASRFNQKATSFCPPEGQPSLAPFAAVPRFQLGQPLQLTATATGAEPLRFQWRRNGLPIPGAIQKTYSVAQATLDDGGTYQLELSNSLGTLVSPSLSVVPNLDLLPASDAFVSAGILGGVNGAGLGSNRGATAEVGEPRHASRRGGHSVWLQYLAPENGLLTVSTRGSDFDTLLAVYTGDTAQQLTSRAAQDDELDQITSTVGLPVRKGTTYRIAIDGRAGAAGNFVLSWNLQPTSAELLEIVQPPQHRTVSVGGTATFSMVALGASAFQWFHNGLPVQNSARVRGASEAQLVIERVETTDLGTYEVEVRNPLHQIRSERVTLQVNPAVLAVTGVESFGVADKFADVFDDRTDILSGAQRIGGTPRPAGLATGISGTQIFSAFGASAEPGEPVHCGVGSGHSQWFSYQAVADGLMVFDTVGSNFDTVLAIYRDTGLGDGLFDGLISIGCNQDATPETRTSRVVVSMEKDTIYYVAIDSTAGSLPGIAVLNYRAFPGTRLAASRPDRPGEVQVTVEGVTGTPVELQSLSLQGNWATLLTTNSPADQFGLRLPSIERSTQLFRVVTR